ncbi:MAG: hypothetical protein C6I00_07500 [Nitratiruptor sp.]|nr:hypothetical protein [Nitratiruptor sp.]NPA82935.1 hypothetical protein [Campylobacterota bacterium]
MSKIAQVREILEQTRELVDEVQRDVSEAIERYNLSLEEHRVAKESIKLATLDELQEALEGIEHLPQEEYEPQIVQEGYAPLEPLDPPEPFEVEEPSEGLFKAKVLGFFTFLVTLVGIVAVGGFMRHIDPLAIDESNWRQSLEEIFGFYSALVTQTPSAGPALGTALAFALAGLLGYLVYWIVANKAAARNLVKARELFEAAKRWSQEQRELIEKLRSIQRFLEEANRTITGTRLFGDEFAARVKRAKFFDGTDYEGMHPVAQEETREALQLQKRLTLLAQSDLLAQEFSIAPAIQKLYEDARTLMERLKARIYG